MADPARNLDDEQYRPQTAQDRANARWGMTPDTPQQSSSGPEKSAREKANERWGMQGDEGDPEIASNSNYNSDTADALQKTETNPDDPDDRTVPEQEQQPPATSDTSTKPKKNLGPVSRRAVRRSLMRRYGASGGGLAGILLTAIIVSLISAPATILINLARKFKNANGLGDHLLQNIGESYLGALIKGDLRSCAESKIKCKFKTVSEKQLENYKARGIEVTYDKTTITSKASSKLGQGDRYKIRGLKFTHPDGSVTEVKTLRDFKNLKYTDPVAWNMLKRWPVRSYLAKYAPFRWVLGKYALEKGNLPEAAEDEDPAKRQADTDKIMDDHTKADPGTTPEELAASAKQAVEEDPNVQSAPDAAGKSSLKTMAKYGSAALLTGIIACTSYDIVHTTAAAIQLLWYTKLAEFAYPFAQEGSALADEGNSTWETAEYFGNRLTTPDSAASVKDLTASSGNTLADANLSPDASGLIGKTAMDAPAMQSVINGDNIPTDTGFAANYNAWAPAAAVEAVGLVESGVDKLPGGKTTARVACQLVKAAALLAIIAQGGQCAIEASTIVGGLLCLGQIGIQTITVNILTGAAAKELVKKIEKPAIDIIAKAHLNHGLVGMRLGQALGSAFGILGAQKDRASGFGIAGTKAQAFAFYNDIKDEYTKSEIADAQFQAKQNQFDITNQYSFAGQLASIFNPYQSDGTIYSSLANILSIGFSPFGQMAYAATPDSSYREGLFEPIQTFVRPGSLEGSFNVCKDPFKAAIGVNCMGESGKLVTYMSPVTTKCMQTEQQDNSDSNLCIDKAVDYLSGNNPDGKVYIDKDTGEPTDWSQYDANSKDKTYKNDLLMLMENCRDRLYDIGYTDTSFDDPNDDWFSGARCAGNNSEGKHIDDQNSFAQAGSGTKLADSTSGTYTPGKEDTKLAWMNYYLTMCTVYKDEEDVPECWSDEQDTNSTASVSPTTEQSAQKGNYKSTQ